MRLTRSNRKLSKFFVWILLTGTVLSLMSVFSAFAAQGGEETVAEKSYADFIGSGFTAAYQVGEVYDTVIESDMGNPRISGFDNVTDMLAAVDLGKVDYAVMASDSIHAHSVESGYKNLAFTFLPDEMFESRNAQIFGTKELRDQYNAFLDGLIASGELGEILDFWLAGDLPSDDAVRSRHVQSTGENGTIVFATSTGYAPMYYLGPDGTQVGMNRELGERFAAYLGKTATFVEMQYAAILPYVQSGKAEMSAPCFSMTAERENSGVYFCKPYMSSYAALIYKSSASTKAVANVYGVMNADGEYDIHNLSDSDAEQNTYSDSEPTWEDYKGKKLAMVVGFDYDSHVEADFETEDVEFFQDYSLMLEAVRAGKVDGAFVDNTAGPIYASQIPELMALDVPKEFYNSPMGFICSDDDLLSQFNVFLRQCKEDGTLAELDQKWMKSGVPTADTEMPALVNTNDPDPITAYLSELTLPFTYVGTGGKVLGYDAELLTMFANHIGRGLSITTVEFNAILPAVASGKADFGAAGMSITEERKKSVNFSDPTYTDTLALMIRKPAASDENGLTAGSVNRLAAQENPNNLTIDDVNGKSVAGLLGSIYVGYAAEFLPDSKGEWFTSNAQAYEAVNQGKVDFYMGEAVSAYSVLLEFPELGYFHVPDWFPAPADGFCISKNNTALKEEFNAFLAELKSGGSYEAMYDRWCSPSFDQDTATMPDINLEDNTGGTLTVAADYTTLPYDYEQNGKPYGFEQELLMRFCEATNRKCKVVDMAFDAIIPYVVSGKADFGAACMSITDERLQSVDFTDPTHYEQTIFVYKIDGAVTEKQQSFIEYLITAVQRNLIQDNRWTLIVDGLAVTLIITVCSMLVGTIIGGLIAYGLTRKNWFAKQLSRLICALINGLPTVTLLMVAYYIIFGSSSISSVIIAISTFSLIMAIRIGQTLQGAIEVVDPVEIEAARASGFTAIGAFLTVTLPQAIKIALPAYLNHFVSLMKETAIVGYVAIQDLMRASDIIRSRTYDAYFPLLFAALIYLIVTSICVIVFRVIIKKVSR
jgi:polar amino acid transport system substrate-binding protein